jgi:predicted DNA-binding protein with PD1-like motif
MKKLVSRMDGELIITILEKDMKVFSRMTKFMDMEDIGFWEDTNMKVTGETEENMAADKLSSPTGIDT